MSPMGRLWIRPGAGQGSRKLKAQAFIREIFYPLTETTVVLALIGFVLLASLAQAAGLLGVWLAVVIVPAFFRYLLYLLEARANGRSPPPPGIELFNWVQNFWSLFPLVLLCILIWGSYFLASNYSITAALLLGLLILFIFPASMAVLSMTRSPLESLNPAALYVLLGSLGLVYLFVPAVVVVMSLFVWYLMTTGAPRIVTNAAEMYTLFLLFSLTGSVLREKGASISVDMPPAREPDAESLHADLTHERTTVLNHAYGFVSRGNRQGGLQHVDDWIEKEVDAEEAYQWFFEQMLKWESNEAALFFAQKYLSWLLEHRRDVQVLKLLARCRLENERFKPLEKDRSAARAAAERQGNDEFYKYLSS
jgi:VanZ family protein